MLGALPTSTPRRLAPAVTGRGREHGQQRAAERRLAKIARADLAGKRGEEPAGTWAVLWWLRGSGGRQSACQGPPRIHRFWGSWTAGEGRAMQTAPRRFALPCLDPSSLLQGAGPLASFDQLRASCSSPSSVSLAFSPLPSAAIPASQTLSRRRPPIAIPSPAITAEMLPPTRLQPGAWSCLVVLALMRQRQEGRALTEPRRRVGKKQFWTGNGIFGSIFQGSTGANS